MKSKLLVTLIAVLLSQTAFADTKAYVKNQGGGRIVLTDEVCSTNENMLRSYKYTGRKDNHKTWEGCWKDDDITIYVKWVDEPHGQRYEKRKFKVVKQW